MSALKYDAVAVFVTLLVSACAAQHHGGGTLAYVGPSKGWYKPGVGGKEAYLTWQKCLEDARQDPRHVALKADARLVKPARRPSKEDEQRRGAPYAFVGKYSRECLASQGFKYMKYPPGEQVYVPPRPPRQYWVKPGVSYMDATRTSLRCYAVADIDPLYLQAKERRWTPLEPGEKEHHVIREEIKNACMTAQGFTYKVLEEHELPPCWYDSSPPCRPVARPERSVGS